MCTQGRLGPWGCPGQNFPWRHDCKRGDMVSCKILHFIAYYLGLMQLGFIFSVTQSCIEKLQGSSFRFLGGGDFWAGAPGQCSPPPIGSPGCVGQILFILCSSVRIWYEWWKSGAVIQSGVLGRSQVIIFCRYLLFKRTKSFNRKSKWE
jgi:hypothetical protein